MTKQREQVSIQAAYERFPDEGDDETRMAMGTARYGFIEGYHAAARPAPSREAIAKIIYGHSNNPDLWEHRFSTDSRIRAFETADIIFKMFSQSGEEALNTTYQKGD